MSRANNKKIVVDVSLDTTNFTTNLDGTITDVQKLADAVDDLTLGAGVSYQYITTSEQGAVSDADVSLGSTTFGTDNLAVLQAILDLSLIHV